MQMVMLTQWLQRDNPTMVGAAASEHPSMVARITIDESPPPIASNSDPDHSNSDPGHYKSDPDHYDSDPDHSYSDPEHYNSDPDSEITNSDHDKMEKCQS